MKRLRRLICWAVGQHRWTSGIVPTRRGMAIRSWCGRCDFRLPT